jgi:hypothetical protein
MKNTIIVIFVLALVGFGVYYFTSSDSTGTSGSPLVASGLAEDSGATFSGRDFLRTLANIESLKLDDKVFGTAIFTSLVDFSVPIQPQPKGRVNPFQPIGVEQL